MNISLLLAMNNQERRLLVFMKNKYNSFWVLNSYYCGLELFFNTPILNN